MSRSTIACSRSAARKGGVGAVLVALAVGGALVVPTGTTASAADWRPQGIPAAAVSSGAAVIFPDATMDPAGNATAVWLSPGEHGNVVQAATRPVGQGSWSPSTSLSTPSGD